MLEKIHRVWIDRLSLQDILYSKQNFKVFWSHVIIQEKARRDLLFDSLTLHGNYVLLLDRVLVMKPGFWSCLGCREYVTQSLVPYKTCYHFCRSCISHHYSASCYCLSSQLVFYFGFHICNMFFSFLYGLVFKSANL